MTKDLCHRSSLLSIALLLFLSTQLTRTSSFLRSRKNMKVTEDCFKLAKSSICKCVPSLFYFEIGCPTEVIDPKIHIRIYRSSIIDIYCHHLDPFEYSLLPEMTIGSVLEVQIDQCPLPPGRSINEIFHRLGISQVNALNFKTLEWGGSVKRVHFEGLRDLDRLTFSARDLSNLPEDLFTGLASLTWLHLHSNMIQLPPKIFSSLENLSFLQLSNNNLSNFPPGIFENQKKLNHLNLSGNNLRNLTKKTFDGVSSITDLDLRSNNIVTLRPDVFSPLTKLRNINLNGNNFESLPQGLFAENKNLSFFCLDHNRVALKELPAKLLGNLLNLLEVRLSCRLNTIPEDLFVNSTDIQNIFISGNSLTELPLMLFADQIELTHLDLSRNRLRSLPDEIFQNTKNLLVLRLSHNNLDHITNDLFSSLTNLNMLFVDNNNLFTIYSKAFTRTLNLTYINMGNNRINLHESYDGELEYGSQFDMQSPFENLHKLETLNLKNNSIRAIFWDWKHVHRKLRMLDLSFNHIPWIIDLEFASKNIFVNLSHNSIQSINFNYINDMDVKNQVIEIDLNNNPIYCDCRLLNFVQFLPTDVRVWIDNLQCNGPINLRGRIVSTLSPKELLCPFDVLLNAEKLCPANCSCWLRSVDQIAIVNCSNTNLTKMPILPVLRPIHIRGTELHIENNMLTNLPNANTSGYMDVVELHASNNSLTQILGSNLPQNLSYLDLSRNKIQRLDITALRVIIQSRTLSVALAHNPWMCDCAAQDLLRFVQLKFRNITDLYQMECIGGQKFQHLSLREICHVTHNLVIAVCVLIAVVGLFATIIAVLYYKQEIKIWLYARGMCLWIVTEEELDKDKKYDAFISYSHKDEDFVTDFLLPELENGPHPYKLCLHVRDWIVGEFIPNQIVRSVDDSRRTIIVLSANFIESIWARMEFRAAHTAALYEGRARVIIIIYGGIDNIDSLDPELNAYLQMNTYVKWGDPWFWKKLHYALPHRSRNFSGFVKTTVKSSRDNKWEFIKSSPVTLPLTTVSAEQACTDPLVTHLNGVVTHAPMLNDNANTSNYMNGTIPNGHATQSGHLNGDNTNANQSDA